MRWVVKRKSVVVIAILIAAVTVFTFSTRRQTVDFSADVKPIFNKKCITCHGGVRRKAGFSLLFRSEALAKNESGKPAIIPGDPEHSELIRRLTLKDPEERMPFKHEPLSKDEIEILRAWIKQGAQWGDHWAYTPVQAQTVPKPSSLFGWMHSENKWPRSDIDYFILDKLKEKELTPSAEADKATLLRRVSLDLVGFPANAKLSANYLNDNSDKAYEALVDSLLASPHYGERWTSMWLDLARYADTKGYERDDSRSIWHYRDWLINAFNEDKPYNQFLTEQLAGDLLPNATDAQFIATAFHRNTMTNDEGGTDNEEFRTAAVMDRVSTTWEALMGTTFACVQCHSHPYDPFKNEEYYSFLAFFNDSRDEDTEADYPLLRHFSDSANTELQKLTVWLQQHAGEQKTKEIRQFLKTWQPAVNSLTSDQFTNSELNDTKWLAFRNHASCRLKNITLDNRDKIIYRFTAGQDAGNWQIHIDSVQGPMIASISISQSKKETGWKIAEANLLPVKGTHDLFFTYTNLHIKDPKFNAVLFDWFYFAGSFPGEQQPGYEEQKKRYWGLLTLQTPTTPVMMDNPKELHRVSHVFERGNWLVKGAVVTPKVPHSLNAFPSNAPNNRLGLAMWITDKKNPLTARTIVNRLWEQLFGVGLVETLEDLGTQGAAPTHRELLDYLSYKFMNDYNWSIKKLLKEMVMSATYRQDGKATKEMLEKDAANKYYARGPRVRLSAEQIRDQALAITGMLSNKMFGPSVMPYQPDGIWLSPWNGQYWINSKGEEKYRRALYTYWKRTAPYPSMMTFDGAAREVCTARRIRTNTPLQALVTLNDEAYLDMARQFAWKLERSHKDNAAEQVKTAYEMATGHSIEARTLASLMHLYKTALKQFETKQEDACEMAGGNSNKYNTANTAALVVVTNSILNLDEVITKN